MFVKRLPRVAKAGLLGAACIGGATLALNPQLLKHPSQWFFASIRLIRCGLYGSVVLCSYLVFVPRRDQP